MKEYHASLAGVSESVHRFFAATFSRVDIAGPEINPEFFKSNRVMITSTHRSHVDYFILGQIMYDLGVENMRFAAGENLTGLPYIGSRFRSFGAFAVKRGSTFSRRYVRDLCEQVVTMLRGGDNIMVFPEGGRSYHGGMLELKGGILGAGILAQARDREQMVYFLPVAVSYECLPELPYFEILGKGRTLRGTGNPLSRFLGSILYFGADIAAFVKFTNAYRFRKNYGRVFVDYGKPVSVGSLVDLDKNVLLGARDEFSAHRTSMQIVGEKLFEQFLSLYRILPMHVLARALYEFGEVSQEKLMDACREIADSGARAGRNMSYVLDMTGREIYTQGLEQFRFARCVSAKGGVVSVRKPSIVQYYAAALA